MRKRNTMFKAVHLDDIVDTDYDITSSDFDLIVTDYQCGSYEGSGEAIIIKDDKYRLVYLGHCSCNGPLDSWQNEPEYDIDQLWELPVTEFNNVKITEFLRWRETNPEPIGYGKDGMYVYEIYAYNNQMMHNRIYQFVDGKIRPTEGMATLNMVVDNLTDKEFNLLKLKSL